MKPWALAGFSGAGKSTVAPLLARLAGRRVVDLDEQIGHARVLELLSRGDDALREAEAAALAELAAGPPDVVVALGGGVLEGDASREVLARSFLVAWLDVPAPACLERCAADAGRRRPVLEEAARGGPEAVAALHSRRTAGARHAMLRIDATPPAGEVARNLLSRLHELENGA